MHNTENKIETNVPNVELQTDSESLDTELLQSPEKKPESTPPPLTADDILSMRLPPADIAVTSGKLIRTDMTISKPPKDQFFRVHPGPDFWGPFGILELPQSGDKYLVPAGSAVHDWMVSTNETCYHRVQMCLAVTLHGVPYIWPLKLTDNKYHESARGLAERAKEKWIRLQTDRKAGYYVCAEAVEQSREPQWPEESFGELLLKGFKDRVVTSMEHEAIKSLRGDA